MQVQINMVEKDGLYVDAVILRNRDSERLAACILAQCDVIWPAEKSEEAEND